MKTILITGINGFLGSKLAKTFKTNYNIVGLEISTANLQRLQDETFSVYESNSEGLEKLFAEQKIDGIIHTATLYGRDDTPKSVLFENNVLNPIVLIEKAVESGLGFFINTDSFFNDGKLSYSYLTDYTLTKKQLIEWLKAFAGPVKIVNMKIYHMYGPDDAPSKFIPWLITQLKNNVPELDLTAGEQTRDFIFIDDVCQAYKTVCNKIDDINDRFSSFNLGTGKSNTLRNFVETAKEAIGSNTKLNFGTKPYRQGEIMKSQCNNQKLYDIGWFSKYDIELGLKSIVNE